MVHQFSVLRTEIGINDRDRMEGFLNHYFFHLLPYPLRDVHEGERRSFALWSMLARSLGMQEWSLFYLYSKRLDSISISVVRTSWLTRGMEEQFIHIKQIHLIKEHLPGLFRL